MMDLPEIGVRGVSIPQCLDVIPRNPGGFKGFPAGFDEGFRIQLGIQFGQIFLRPKQVAGRQPVSTVCTVYDLVEAVFTIHADCLPEQQEMVPAAGKGEKQRVDHLFDGVLFQDCPGFDEKGSQEFRDKVLGVSAHPERKSAVLVRVQPFIDLVRGHRDPSYGFFLSARDKHAYPGVQALASAEGDEHFFLHATQYTKILPCRQ